MWASDRSTDYVAMGVIPAGRVRVDGQIVDERRFHLELRSDATHWISATAMTWEDALHEMRNYRCRTEEQAVELWERSELGNQLEQRIVSNGHRPTSG